MYVRKHFHMYVTGTSSWREWGMVLQTFTLLTGRIITEKLYALTKWPYIIRVAILIKEASDRGLDNQLSTRHISKL